LTLHALAPKCTNFNDEQPPKQPPDRFGGLFSSFTAVFVPFGALQWLFWWLFSASSH
jgi:hypothetical protein